MPATDWGEVWAWARSVWGDDPDHSFNAFFRRVACALAEREGWEEVGSSDVWHASFWCLKLACDTYEVKSKINSREDLIRYVQDSQAVYL